MLNYVLCTIQYIAMNKIKFNTWVYKEIKFKYAYCNPRSTNIGKRTSIK